MTNRTHPLARPVAKRPTACPEPPADSQLEPSVITSCSPRNLRYLFTELGGVDHLYRFDLFAFRETDLIALCDWIKRGDPALFHRRGGPLAFASTTALLTGFPLSVPLAPWDDADSVLIRRHILDWLVDEVAPFRVDPGRSVSFAALATYFPDITAVDENRRGRARRALTEVVLLALGLHDRDPTLFPYPVVELVCGTRVDRCECADCTACARCFVSKGHWKIKLLIKELTEVVEAAHSRRPCGRGCGVRTASRWRWNWNPATLTYFAIARN